MKRHTSTRKEIVKIGQWLHQKGLVAAMDGNISARVGDDCILSTPTCISKGMMQPDDLVLVALHGRKLGGSSENRGA